MCKVCEVGQYSGDSDMSYCETCAATEKPSLDADPLQLANDPFGRTGRSLCINCNDFISNAETWRRLGPRKDN